MVSKIVRRHRQSVCRLKDNTLLYAKAMQIASTIGYSFLQKLIFSAGWVTLGSLPMSYLKHIVLLKGQCDTMA